MQTFWRSRPRSLGFLELNERRCRQWAAAEARVLGWGGLSLVALATGLSRPTILTADELARVQLKPHEFHGELISLNVELISLNVDRNRAYILAH
jgi:hypothetical protein